MKEFKEWDGFEVEKDFRGCHLHIKVQNPGHAESGFKKLTVNGEELKDNYIILFRMHAYTNQLLGLEFNDTIRDYSAYPNVNDLFKVADILISDYSASMSDYAIIERPVLCFTYDYEQYRDERGLYLDFDKDMPSGILRTDDDVLKYIKNMDYEKECEKTRIMIKEKLIHLGGHATEMCLVKLFEK